MISSRAFAKINLGLRIVNKREDNYHNIETIFTTVSLWDELEVDLDKDGIELITSGIPVAPTRTNLAYRAAEIFLKRFKINRGLRIILKKAIPIGSGLGGGSSDAASVLRTLATLFDLKNSDDRLVEIAKDLGMDVPFFLKGGAALARGRGDELDYFDLPRMRLIIYYPGFSISTRWAYSNIDLSNLTKDPNLINMLKDSFEEKDFNGIRRYLINDFEPLIFRTYPELKEIKDRFLELGAIGALLSGSGSSIYAIVDQKSEEAISEFLNQRQRTFFKVETVKPDFYQ